MDSDRIDVRSLVAFFLLTFGFSWVIRLPKVLATNGLSTGLEGLPEVDAFGPTVAAVLLTYLYGGWAVRQTIAQSGPRYHLRRRW